MESDHDDLVLEAIPHPGQQQGCDDDYGQGLGGDGRRVDDPFHGAGHVNKGRQQQTRAQGDAEAYQHLFQGHPGVTGKVGPVSPEGFADGGRSWELPVRDILQGYNGLPYANGDDGNDGNGRPPDQGGTKGVSPPVDGVGTGGPSRRRSCQERPSCNPASQAAQRR